MTKEIEIRKATQADADFVAWALCTAVGASMDDKGAAGALTRLVLDDGTLYSWRSAWIATSGGKPAGATIAYDGGGYAKRRITTFQMLRDIVGLDLTAQDDEAEPGEFYIDTLAVVSAFRRQGIGTELLRHSIAEARARGLAYATLAVHPDNLRAQALYKSLGFERDKDIFIFGETYWKMRRPLSMEPFGSSPQTR